MSADLLIAAVNFPPSRSSYEKCFRQWLRIAVVLNIGRLEMLVEFRGLKLAVMLEGRRTTASPGCADTSAQQ